MGGIVGTLLHQAHAVTLAWNMIWAALCMNVVYLFPFSKMSKEGWCLMLVQCAWRTSLFFSPWVWCIDVSDSSREWGRVLDATSAADKPVFILGNHTSFMDTLLSAAKLPSAVLWRCRTYMDYHLFKLPILSTICKSVGHFPVYFTSEKVGVFKVDNERMTLVEKTVDEHLGNGGWLCFFPEGQMNRTADEIMDFRFGGMKRALAADARLVFFVAHGNPRVWPRKATVGGFPGRIRYSVKTIAPEGAKAFVAQLREAGLSEEEQGLEDHALLARRLRQLMQEQYNELSDAAKAKST